MIKNRGGKKVLSFRKRSKLMTYLHNSNFPKKDDETEKQSNIVRRIAKRMTGSPHIHIDGCGISNEL